jgi:hypothetical protein
MRKLLAASSGAALVAAGALVLAFAGGAQAAPNCAAPPACNVTAVSFTSSDTKAGDKLTSATVNLGDDFIPPGVTPQTLVPSIETHTDVTLPVVFNGSKFFSCSKSDVDTYEAAIAQGQSPPKNCAKAQIGTGTAAAFAVVCNTHPARNSAAAIPVTLGISLFNSGSGLVSFLKATSPAAFSAIQGSFAISVAPASGGGSTLSWDLPDALMEAVQGTCSPITNVTFNLNQTPAASTGKGTKASTAKKKHKKKKKKSKAVFLKNAPCAGGHYTASHHVVFSDGSENPDHTLTRVKTDEATSTATSACTP